MKVRNGFVSNSSSSSFIINCDFNDVAVAYNKNYGYHEEWTPNDILNWVKSMVKREYKREGRNLSEDFINENIKIGTVKELSEELDLPYWYAGRLLHYDSDFVVYDTCDNLISDEVGKKIAKKFDVRAYEMHMG